MVQPSPLILSESGKLSPRTAHGSARLDWRGWGPSFEGTALLEARTESLCAPSAAREQNAVKG